ncbi:MAG: GNAT family N-acetyltransferase [Pseudomonadota bacterium]
MRFEVKALDGNSFYEAIPVLAQLRIQIFRDWPYLYDGDFEYEQRYLKRFLEADRAFMAAAICDGKIVGAATAAPLAGEAEEFRAPFERAGYDTSKVFYFAESLLIHEFRGQGIGHKFFDLREGHARSFGAFTHTCFCGVVRHENSPAKPKDYRPLNEFWEKRGYKMMPGLKTEYSWKDIGSSVETKKPMQFWMAEL